MTGSLCGMLNRGAATQHDEVGDGDLLAARCRAVEGSLHALEGRDDLGELGRLVDLRVLNANFAKSPLGVLTTSPETLTNDFFVNLLSMDTDWKKSARCEHFYEGKDRQSGELRWTASAVDLLIGSHSELRALAEVYASDDAKGKFVKDFIAAWDKVMTSDRFELNT